MKSWNNHPLSSSTLKPRFFQVFQHDSATQTKASQKTNQLLTKTVFQIAFDIALSPRRGILKHLNRRKQPSKDHPPISLLQSTTEIWRGENIGRYPCKVGQLAVSFCFLLCMKINKHHNNGCSPGIIYFWGKSLPLVPFCCDLKKLRELFKELRICMTRPWKKGWNQRWAATMVDSMLGGLKYSLLTKKQQRTKEA